jgi:hypothetical protein
MEEIDFTIQISAISEDSLSGYLFLCPRPDFRVGKSVFGWPNCPAYWSRDPFGLERLNTEEATRFGFPSIELTIRPRGRSWDASVYAGLRQFHRGKGFDPDSQDVARHLVEPLYQLSHEIEPLFAHGESTISFNYSVLSHNIMSSGSR